VKAMNIAILRVGETTFFANVTTAIGFGVFGLTSSEILTQFGIVASINVMLTWIISLILIPIIFTYLPNPKSWQTKHLENRGLNAVIKKIDFWVHNYSKYVYGITILIVIISLYGMTKINVNGYMVDDLPQKDPVLTDLKFFERNFDGVLPLEVQIDSKRKNGLLNIATIKKIEKLDKMMSTYPEFSRSISLNEVLKFSKQAFYNGDPSFYQLPSEGEAAFILQYAKNSGGNGSMLNSYIDSLNQKTRVSFQVKDVGSNRMNKLLDEVKLRIDSIFNPKKYDVLLTGASVISVKGSNYLLVNLIESLLIAIGLISILMLVLFRTFKMVMISLIPNIIPLLITAGIMGFLGMSLKPSTILIFSIAFGIASDQTLYYLTKFRHEQYTKDWSISKIVSVTLKEAGLGMIYTAIILFFGFGIFSASNFGGTVALGILLSITLLVALISNLILLPTLLLSLERKLEKKKNK
jgi:predicted RND superfamily exporter protein